jgi:hypothetical protein
MLLTLATQCPKQSRPCQVVCGIPYAAIAAWRTDDGLAAREQLCPVNNPGFRERYIGTSKQGSAYFWRTARNLVSFPVIDPQKDIEAVCYILLCEHVAFDTERHFKLLYPIYAQAAYSLGLVDSFDKLQSHVARHVKCAYASKSLTVEQILVAQAIMRPAMPAPNTCICLHNLRAQAIRAEAVSRMPDDVTLDE